MPDGIFVAVVGPSGAGKDTLLKLASEKLADRADILFVKRVITREPDGKTEDHDTLDVEAFEQADRDGAFCLSWGAHGLRYGLPMSAYEAVRNSETVVANVSRTVFEQALKTFGRLAIIEITADPNVLAQRIALRGRESASDAVQRLSRSIAISPPAGVLQMKIDNSGTMNLAADTLAKALLSLSHDASVVSC